MVENFVKIHSLKKSFLNNSISFEKEPYFSASRGNKFEKKRNKNIVNEKPNSIKNAMNIMYLVMS